MVNAIEVTQRSEKNYLHGAWQTVEAQFATFGVDFKATLPRTTAVQLAAIIEAIRAIFLDTLICRAAVF